MHARVECRCHESTGDAVRDDIRKGGGAASLTLLPLDLLHVCCAEYEHAGVADFCGCTRLTYRASPCHQSRANEHINGHHVIRWGGGGMRNTFLLSTHPPPLRTHTHTHNFSFPVLMNNFIKHARNDAHNLALLFLFLVTFSKVRFTHILHGVNPLLLSEDIKIEKL